jgi:hypothetical protein
MRPAFALLPAAVAALSVYAAPAAAVSHPTAQSRACTRTADTEHRKGADRARYLKACLRGSAAPLRPTAPTGPGKEARAITAPSGADRNERSAQCSAEADRRGLTEKDRNAFRLSCLATAGPVSEGETHDQTPKPAPAIKGIGVNHYDADKSKQPH